MRRAVRRLWAIGCFYGHQRLADLKLLPVDELSGLCEDWMELVKAEGQAPPSERD